MVAFSEVERLKIHSPPSAAGCNVHRPERPPSTARRRHLPPPCLFPTSNATPSFHSLKCQVMLSHVGFRQPRCQPLWHDCHPTQTVMFLQLFFQPGKTLSLQLLQHHMLQRPSQEPIHATHCPLCRVCHSDGGSPEPRAFRSRLLVQAATAAPSTQNFQTLKPVEPPLQTHTFQAKGLARVPDLRLCVDVGRVDAIPRA